jgi:hypothetical protein
MAGTLNYNTQSMHSTAKTIQSNGHEWQGDLHNLWSLYQTDMYGAFPELASHLTAFMDLCKGPSLSLAQNRTDLGTKLDKAATAAEQTDTKVGTGFRMMPQ